MGIKASGKKWTETITLVFTAYAKPFCCLLYTSDAADDLPCVDLGGRRIIKKKKTAKKNTKKNNSRDRHTTSIIQRMSENTH